MSGRDTTGWSLMIVMQVLVSRTWRVDTTSRVAVGARHHGVR